MYVIVEVLTQKNEKVEAEMKAENAIYSWKSRKENQSNPERWIKISIVKMAYVLS